MLIIQRKIILFSSNESSIHTHAVSKEEIEAFSANELSAHLIEDKEFAVREVETLEGKSKHNNLTYIVAPK